MNPFGMGNAWSYGFRFLAGRAVGQAVILIGLGVLAPFALQYAIGGGPPGTVSLTAMGQAAMGTGLPAAPMLLLAAALGLVLQSASYFASWRLGFGVSRSLAGPILYGFVAGLLAIALVAVVGILAALAARQVGASGMAFLAVLVFLIPVIAAVALFYTIPAAVVGAAIWLLLGGAMAYGAATGQIGLAATLVGGSGAVAVLLLVLSAVLMWLAARLSCTASVLADRKSFNLIAAARESWRLTWDEQWAIMRYLALIGVGLALLLIVGAVVAGIGAAAMVQEQGPALDIGNAILGLVLGIPFAFVTVMVPAGIYRELTGSAVAAEVFA